MGRCPGKGAQCDQIIEPVLIVMDIGLPDGSLDNGCF